MGYSFLLIGEKTQTQWPLLLYKALSSLGDLSIVSEDKAIQTIVQRDYDVVIVDAGAVHDVVRLVSSLRAQRQGMRVVVATSSPTWQRAREALQAGAADYIRKSLDKKELCSNIKAVLELPPPP
jgi:DNA-binding response OmpR family regulator